MSCNKKCNNDKCDKDACDNNISGLLDDFLESFKKLTKEEQVITFHKILESFDNTEEDLQ